MVLVGVGKLSWTEWQSKDGCPHLGGVPVCYVILIAVLLLLLYLMIPSIRRIWMFLIGAGLPFGIALLASIAQFFLLAECPKNELEHPMCYYSLLMFGIVIGLEVRLQRLDSVTSSSDM